jgi:GDP-4-dehydro-6-deoxy-D-mannose reductase
VVVSALLPERELKMKALITGITGMIGLHCARAAREAGWETFGIARNSASSRLAAIEDSSVIRRDMMDYQALEEVFRSVKPDVVIHMAAQAFNGTSWQMEWSTHQANYLGTINVLRCCRVVVPDAKVLIACSSAEYGDVKPEDCPLKEERLLRPISPYGVTKVATEALGFQHFHNYSLQVYLPRLFIHVGTGHPPATAIQNFARQLALISKGRLSPEVHVGNLQSARDFIDVRDGVAAMMLLLAKGPAGQPVNICTGEAVSIQEVLDTLIEISGQKVTIIPDPQLVRPSDEPLLLGDNTKLKSLGWDRKYSIRDTLEAVYADWLARI